MLSYLRFDKNQVDELHDEIMFNIFVREALAPRALRKSNAFAESSVVGFAISRV